MRPGRLVSVALVLAALASCSSSKRPLGSASDEPASDDPVDGGADGDAAAGSTGIDISNKPQPDAACGYASINAKQEPANLYLVIDRSGSMAQSPPGSASSKYAAVGKAVVSLVKNIGWRSKISLTLFPSGAGGGQCQPGSEVLPLQPGDPKSFQANGQTGPVAQTLQKIFQVSPAGGTPTGSTLAALAAKGGFGKDSYVLLATDGAPNCNPKASCDADHCIVNIEQDMGCPSGVNCCDPSVDPNYTGANCIDRDATLDAVLTLSSMGVKTIVIGIPGSEKGPYAETLSLLAVAGGAPRPGDVRYYRVEDVGELESLLATIGSEVLVSCDVSLDKAPDAPDQVNIYFDDQLVPYDEGEGWTWSGPQSLTLHGKACDTLLSGSVGQIQMLVGCPTATIN